MYDLFAVLRLPMHVLHVLAVHLVVGAVTRKLVSLWQHNQVTCSACLLISSAAADHAVACWCM